MKAFKMMAILAIAGLVVMAGGCYKCCKGGKSTEAKPITEKKADAPK